jgi:hypothetical protein
LDRIKKLKAFYVDSKLLNRIKTAALSNPESKNDSKLTTENETENSSDAPRRNDEAYGDAPKVKDETPKYFFKRTGELWMIHFESEQGNFAPIDGFVYIAHLLENPGRSFSAEDLKKLTAVSDAASNVLSQGSEEILEGQVGMTQETRQDAIDLATIRACEKRLSEIPTEQNAARQAGDVKKLDDLEEEEKKINDYLTRSQKIRGDSRPLADSQRSLFYSVKQAVERAIKKLKSAKPPLFKLYEHLTNSIDFHNGNFEYRPRRPVPAWQF